MLVLANEMFDSPPVFAWVLPVFVRLKLGKEETFSPRHGHVFFVFSTWSTSRRRQTMKGPVGKGQGKPGRGSFSIRRPTWRSCSLRKQRTRSARFSSPPVSLHSRMEGGTSTVVNGLPTTGNLYRKPHSVERSEVAGQKMY
jgi:hypothetical protein